MTDRQSPQGGRIHWMDNLRTILILMIVLYHVGGVYEAAGLWGWFWIVDDPATISWVGIVGILFDIVAIPTLFFISGYLAPASLQSKTAWAFVTVKLARLMIPWAIAVVTLIPLYKVIFLLSRGLPQEPWSTYFHLTNPNSQNWLWFLPVVMAFNVLYLLASRLRGRIKLPLWGLALAAFVLAVAYSMAAGGLLGFRSWTLTPLLDFENERLLLYVMAFLAGALCYHRRTFAARPQSRTLYTVLSSVAWIPITVHIMARVYPVLYAAGFTVTPLFRLVWWLSFHASAIIMLYLLVASFWWYLDRSGPVWRYLGRNSYGVYIIHVIVIGVLGTLLLKVAMPAVAKYLALMVLTYLCSNALVALGRRILLAAKAAGGERHAEHLPGPGV